jgi:glycosyltransferase involved in cell wall biosynthesis
MKIAILSPWTVKPTSIGGTERFVIDLAESFINANNEVDVYMLSGDSYIKNKVNYISMNLFKDINEVDEYFLKSQFNQFNDEQSFENLAKKIEDKISFDTYDLIQLNSQLFLKVAEEKTRIFTIHTNPFEYKLDWGEISFEIMLKLMYKESTMEKTYFVTPSKYYANLYKDLSNTNIYFIPHAIDVSRITSDNDRNQILDKMNIEQNKKIILLPSRLEPIQKQPMLFMKAFALLDDNIKSNYKVICTGKDKQYEQYMDDILNFCQKNNIDILIDRFDKMSDGYKVADIVMLPSKSESFGYSALEALSLGIVTILNNIPTYKEIVDGAKNYYLFDNSVESLNEVLKEVLIKKIDRVNQTEDWKNRYSTKLFCIRYSNLINIKK